ncbi:glycosyl hydrolase [Olivibacter sp. XZL3]|uniref:glycosyl hydrolase n=1 Tax=Olivibacter sp. XZL3 TaxID=1735116 RepID=UPI001064FE82|nr:glycosyl hydrolase [Olivibacter sp. XZL3]
MLKKIQYIFIISLALVWGCQRKADTLWPEVTKEMKPWTRWWWMGNAVDSTNLRALLKEYEQRGFGGVEVAPIYGAKGYENQYIDHLSEEWIKHLRFTLRVADSLGMGVDLTNGTGWPFGGPQVEEGDAATKLIVSTYKLHAKQPLKETIKSSDPKQPNASLVSLTAYGSDNQTILLTDKVDHTGRLQWTAEKGTWELYALFLGKTKQRVKRAAPGGEGFTLDHFSKEALDRYLQPYARALGKERIGIRAFYNDSYEVYGADWTETLLKTFETNRGYDLRYHVRDLLSRDSTERIARIKSDYRETVAEMLLNNFTRHWTDWAHEHHGITKNQAHGSPGNLLDLYAAVDIPEAETFGSSYFPIPGLRRDSADIRNVDPDPMMLKFASSAAHVSGKNLVSNETFTWLTEHFKTSWAQCKPEVDQVFLAGINHVFYHGTTYSPQQAPWPGWLFYASVNFVPANSLWSHLDGLNQYITRVQSVLQAGKADNELLIYWPIYDIWHQAKGGLQALKVHDIDEWLHPTEFYKQALHLQEEGYAFDFVSDHLLEKLQVQDGKWMSGKEPLSHRALLVPKTGKMPVETLERMIQLAKDGATLIFQSLPTDVPGAHDLERRRAKLAQLVQSIRKMSKQPNAGKGKIIVREALDEGLREVGLSGEALVKAGLQFVRRKVGADTYYYMVNLTDKAVNEELSFGMKDVFCYMMDPLSGKTGKASVRSADGQIAIKVQLESGESCILAVVQEERPNEPEWLYPEKPLVSFSLTGNWQLSFKDGGPTTPRARTLNRLIPWTGLQDSAANDFSGKAVYSLDFDLPASEGKDYVLRLDSIFESARVIINGKEAGLIWSLPYKLHLGTLVRQGKNTIEIEVANLMANRIRYIDRKKLKWREYNGSQFVNIDYEPFDASNWKTVPAGLAGHARIEVY